MNNNPKCADNEKSGVTGLGPGLFYEGPFAILFGVAFLVIAEIWSPVVDGALGQTRQTTIKGR